MTYAPERVHLAVNDGAIWGPLAHTDKRAIEYIRADLHDAQLAALRDRVEALSLALSHIDAMDPEERMIGGVSESAAKGLILRMGEIARAALKADQ